VQSKETVGYDEETDDVQVTPPVGDDIDHQSSLMTSSLLLQPDDVTVTSSSSRDFAEDVRTEDRLIADPSPFS